MRGAGVPEAGGRCLRNYKLILYGLIKYEQKVNLGIHKYSVIDKNLKYILNWRDGCKCRRASTGLWDDWGKFEGGARW